MKPKKHKRWKRIVIVLLLLLVLAVAEGFWSNYTLCVTRYQLRSEKVVGSLRIVWLSDLHGREFGEENARLLDKLREASPDLIALGGDVFNEDAEETELAAMCGLIRRAAEIAPVYFCVGNHEYNYMKRNGDGLLRRVEEAGATVLESEFVDLEINGTPFRLGGYMGFYRQPGMFSNDAAQWQIELGFADAFEDTDRFKLLLNHIPTGWLDWNYRDRFPVDLVLSGHYHGGVVRIPLFGQGLYAPYVGWFPPYTKGLYEGKAATCILSTGLAGSYGIPRFFNAPELVVVDLIH